MFHIFDECPKFVRNIALGTLIFFLLLGFAVTAKALTVSFGSFLINYLFYVLLGGVMCVAIPYCWRFLTGSAGKNTVHKLHTLYEERGYSPELAETAKNAAVFPRNSDHLLTLFLLMMAEDYKAAEATFLKMNILELDNREEAMYYTCRLHIYQMTGQHERFVRLFDERQKKQDKAYDTKPEFYDQYIPYADDAMVYYVTASAYCARCGDEAGAAEYHRKAVFQASLRDDIDRDLYPGIFELNQLFATGKFEEAHQRETEIENEIYGTPMSAGHRNDLLRLLGQAKIYGKYIEYTDKRVEKEREIPAGYAEKESLPSFLTEM